MAFNPWVIAVITVVVVLAAVIAGSIRVERDPLVRRPPRRFGSELVGFGLIGAAIASVAYANRAFRGSRPSVEAAGASFVFMAAVLGGSYLLPEHNSVFRALSTLWENAPGPTGGRSGLMFLGIIFGLVGLCLVFVGSGLVG